MKFKGLILLLGVILCINYALAASVYYNDQPSININESDPVWAASPSFNVTSLWISQWNSAYGWGNHADAGYWNERVPGYLSQVSRISFNKTAGYSGSEGDLYWDAAYKTLSLKGEDWTLQVGQEQYLIVYNDKAYSLINGHGITPDGSNSGFMTVEYADSSTQGTGIVLGVLTQTIAPGQTGMVTILGIVNDINTSAWAPGTTLYIDEVGNGELTDVKPVCAACYPMTVGQVVKQGEQGSMFVRSRTAEVDPIFSNSDAYSITYNQTVNWDTAFGWGDHSLAGYLTSGSIGGFLNATDQRYNDTTLINAVNTTANIQGLGFNTTAQLNGLYLGVGDQRYNDTVLINAVNTTVNIQGLGFNTTAQLNNVYLGIYDQRYNDTLLISNRAGPGSCPANQFVVNTTTGGVQCLEESDPKFIAANSTIWAAINGKVSGNGTTNYIAMWQNGSLVDSPIHRTISDEDNLQFYDGGLYIDDTNGMVGINVPNGEPQSYISAFTVQSELHEGTGTITLVSSDYDGYSTGVTSTDPLPESFVDAGTVTINEVGLTVYIYSVTNLTYFRIRGNIPGNHVSTNWSWQQAPYIDVNGPANTERGYTISSDGAWQWAMMTPDDSNNTQFCLQNRNAWFNGQNYAYCADSNGDMIIYGDLSADAVNFPRYTGIVNDTALVTQGTTGVANVPANIVNCWDDNSYTNTLRAKSVPAANLSLTLGIEVVNYIYIQCGANPVYQVTTDRLIIDNIEKVLIAKVFYTNTGSPIHIENVPTYGTGKPGRTYNRLLDTEEFALSESTSIVLGNSGTNVTLATFRVWAGITPYDVPVTSNATRKFEMFRNADATWNYTTTASTVFNNTHFDNGTGMQRFSTGKFGIVNVYRGVEIQDHIYYVNEPAEYDSQILASAVTSLQQPPVMVKAHAIFVGRIIFQESNSSAIYPISYVPGTSFTASNPVQTHNQLDGLEGGSVGSYYHLGLVDYSKVTGSVWDSINTTANIQGLGFNTTAQLNSLYLGINDQRYNDTAAINLKLNITDQRYNDTTAISNKASPGNCPSGQVVMNTTTSGVQCIAVTTTGDGTGGWVNDSTQTRTSLSVNTTGSIYVGNASTGSIIANKELILGQVGDVDGNTYLILRNRFLENGAIYYNPDPANTLIDFIFKTNITQRNIRLENRAGQILVSNPEFHIGGTTSDIPGLVVGDTSSAFAGKLVIGSYNGSTGLTIRNTSATNMDLYYPVGNFTITDGSDAVVTFTQDDNAIFQKNVTAGLFRGRVENYLNTTEIAALGYLNATGVVASVGNFSAANSTLARTGNCPSGQFVTNTTIGGVVCSAATVTSVFGEMSYPYSATGFTITMTTQNVYYNLTNAGIVLNNGNGCSVTSNLYINCSTSGTYLVEATLVNIIDNNDNLRYAIFNNNNEELDSTSVNRISSGIPQTVSTRTTLTYVAGQPIQLRVRDNTRNGAQITVYRYNIIIQKMS